ncbi:pimeloyl-ACP methyl ester carboxylesterase [Novosphingobium kunmingense]|uniref:Pimeloyl-ACP methyl ester carboxylesterase n=1 Tax=Novosphingobium kunmingense TaxID=1211806 RepID=A0A2N0I211_9SPHN|nr:epoxide hydrolase family protein [Novosphingobium kunmingense]PKB25212.1 pimeloyl-ACP methyl ester carboxylesterase [Novosphingobium kunmingense]
MTAIRPFTLDVAQPHLDDLKARLAQTRWPERETVDDWSQGAPLEAVKDLVGYWRRDYDWRRCEARLNALGQFVTEIDGLDIHFLHVRSPYPEAMPLVITHGWPGSVIEFMGVIEQLADPVRFGGRAEDAFHVVAPSLPGFGFSGKPATKGWGVEQIGRAWGQLMARLGYTRWVAQGGDWGSAVTTAIGVQNVAGCIGIHINMPIGRPTEADLANPTPAELKALTALKHYQDWDSGYSTQQRTRPQTVGYGLVDSPAGLAAWIFEKMWAWTDNEGSPYDALSRDQILDNIMLYWLPATGASSARLYWESFGSFVPQEIAVPVGVSAFPKEILPTPRKWAERNYKRLVHWGTLEKGGHFAAWEQPEAFVGELRTAFALMR